MDSGNSVSSDSEIEEAFKNGCDALIPVRSKERYERAYENFMRWITEKNADITEKSVFAYFVQRNKILKSPASMWSEYSMLKTMINLNKNINISSFTKLIAFLKQKNAGYRPRKSKVFTRQDMITFLNEAPDDIYLLMKVVMIVGVAGALRREEILKITTKDIDDRGSVIVINIPTSKTNRARTFIIIDIPDEQVHFLTLFRKYYNLRPKNALSSRFFLGYRRGKCVNQVVGIETIGKVPSKIAQFLKLDDAQSYTGHAFRRSSATFLADKGADILDIKRHGGWKSTTVAEGYVEDSLQKKMTYAYQILHNPIEMTEQTTEQNLEPPKSNRTVVEMQSSDAKSVAQTLPINFNSSVNCNFHIVINK